MIEIGKEAYVLSEQLLELQQIMKSKEEVNEMKKLAIILMLLWMGLMFGCSEENHKAAQKARELDKQNTAMKNEIQAILTRPQTGGGYITDRERENNRMKKQREICEVFVGKTFIANTEDKIFNKFHDKVGQIEGFRVQSPENFLVVKLVGDFGKMNANGYIIFDPWADGWYEIKFESGKIAFVEVKYFKYVTNPPAEIPIAN